MELSERILESLRLDGPGTADRVAKRIECNRQQAARALSKLVASRRARVHRTFGRSIYSYVEPMARCTAWSDAEREDDRIAELQELSELDLACRGGWGCVDG
jgi:predicted ArsR family transcriptional regulator